MEIKQTNPEDDPNSKNSGENAAPNSLKIKDRKDLDKLFKIHGVKTIGQSDGQLVQEAARYGENDIIEFLLPMCPPTQLKNDLGETLIHTAARSNRVETIHYLIQKGFHPNEKSTLGETPLMQAAEDGCIEAVKFLCQNEHVNIQDTNRFGETCLHFAAKEGRITIGEYILKRAPELVRAENKKGRTPLFYALQGSQRELIILLDDTEKFLNKRDNTN